LAVGANRLITIHGQSVNPAIGSINVVSDFIPNPYVPDSAGWVVKNGSDYMVVAATDDRKFYVTFNRPSYFRTGQAQILALYHK
jgi:hypothetical protein